MPREVAKIQIVLLDNGRVELNHPPDKILCYGLLELAKEMIKVQAAQQKPLIQPAAVIPSVKVG